MLTTKHLQQINMCTVKVFGERYQNYHFKTQCKRFGTEKKIGKPIR